MPSLLIFYFFTFKHPFRPVTCAKSRGEEIEVTGYARCCFMQLTAGLPARRQTEGRTKGRKNADKCLHYKLPDFILFHGILFKVKHVFTGYASCYPAGWAGTLGSALASTGICLAVIPASNDLTNLPVRCPFSL